MPLPAQSRPAADRPRAAIYARFSSDLQSARSAEDQARVCREHAAREGWDVVDVFSDLAISGTQNNRPGLNALLAAAEAGAFDVILAEALDRVSRHMADIATIHQRIEFAGAQLHTISEGRVTELHVGFAGTMNAVFVKELASKIRRGQRGSVARGLVPGGICYGYRPEPKVVDGQVELGHRAIVPEEADVIRRIFAWTLQGESVKAIAHRLNAEGIPSPRGSLWAGSTISGSRGRANGILHNPAYVGKILYNRVTMKRDPRSRKRVSRANAEADRVEADAEHLRIIDDATWTAVQQRREDRAHIPWHQQRRAKHMLSGLILCGECGARYTVINRDRWGCRGHRETGTCDNNRRVSTETLERRVIGGLQAQLLAPEVVARVVKRYHDARAAERKATATTIDDARKRIADLRAQIAALVDSLAMGMDIAEVRAGIDSRKEQLAIAEAQLAEAEAVPQIILHPQIVEQYRRRIAMIGDAVVKGERAQRFLPIIRGLIEAVHVRDQPTDP
ncbi:MAG: recombinase family protein, partial [Sphingomonadales bacterium]|nr:recombinase family protein [Sphingomonadales bacterium]